MLWCFDLDGVVLNTYDILKEAVAKHCNVSFDDVPMCYDPYKSVPGITKDEFLLYFDEAVKNDTIPAMDGAIETLTKYYEKNKRLIFITHRNSHNVPPTREWLRKHLKLPYELYACYKCEKSIIAESLNAEGIIDDLPSVCQEFIDAGKSARLFEAPWHIHQEVNPNIPIVRNWVDIASVIL